METFKKVLHYGLIVLKVLAIVAVVFFLGWLAVTGRFNIGSIIKKLWGSDEIPNPSILDGQGNVIGQAVKIKKNENPLRDKSIIELENGTRVQLPKGVIDTDVSKVIMNKPGVYNVQVNSGKSTDIFDDPSSLFGKQ